MNIGGHAAATQESHAASHASVATYVRVALILTAVTALEVGVIYIRFLTPIVVPLLLVIPPLLLKGLPAEMADALLRPLLARPLTAAVARTVTRPLPAFSLYAVGLIGWHLPAPYNAALEMHGWHVVEHLVLVSTAVLG